MHDCTVTSTAGKSDLTAVVVGHSARKLPRLVESVAARIAKGELSGAQRVLAEDGTYLLVKPAEKPWLIGGENLVTMC